MTKKQIVSEKQIFFVNLYQQGFLQCLSNLKTNREVSDREKE